MLAAPLNPLDRAVAAGSLLRRPSAAALRAGLRVRRARAARAGSSGRSAAGSGSPGTARWPSGREPGSSRRRGAGRRRPGARGGARDRRASPAGCRSRGGRRFGQGDRVLVLGATGTAGEVAVQAAKLSAPRTSSRPAATQRRLRAGARARRRRGRSPLDGDFGEPTYVFDPLCGEPLERAVAAAAPGARIVQLGQSAGPTGRRSLRPRSGRQAARDLRLLRTSRRLADVLAEHYRALVGQCAGGRDRARRRACSRSHEIGVRPGTGRASSSSSLRTR